MRVCVGSSVIFISMEACCAALCHVAALHPAACVCVLGGGPQAYVNLYENLAREVWMLEREPVHMPECEYVCVLIDRSRFIPVHILEFSTARGTSDS